MQSASQAGGGAVVSRTTSEVGRRIRSTDSGRSGPMIAIRARTASWPLLSNSWWTVELRARRDGQRGVVESHDRQVFGDPQAERLGDVHGAQGERVGEAQDGGGSVGPVEHFPRHRLHCEAGPEPRRVHLGLDANRLEGLAPARHPLAGWEVPGRDAVDLEVGAEREQRDPGVPEVHEVLGGRASASPVVHVDAGCVRVGSRSTETIGRPRRSSQAMSGDAGSQK